MKLPKGVEWAAHCLVVLAHLGDRPVSTTMLAEIYGLSPTYLNKHLQALSQHGLLTSAPGLSGGFSLSRPAGEISLADVVAALDGDGSVFRCTEIRCEGLFSERSEEIRGSGPCAIAAAMWKAEAAWRATLAAVPITDLTNGIDPTSSQELERFVTQKNQKGGKNI